MDRVIVPCDKFTYARMRLFLATVPDVTPPHATLIAIETNRLNFVAKDIFLELRNCIDVATTASKAVGFNISVSRMRKRYYISDKVELSTDHPTFTSSGDSGKTTTYADFAKLFERRAGERRYVATGYSTQLTKSYSREALDDDDTHGETALPGRHGSPRFISPSWQTRR